MDAGGVVPEETELAALLRVNADTGRADQVYRVLHRTRTLVRQVCEATAQVVEAWFRSDAAAEAGVEKWDARKVREGVVKGGGGWHGQGWLGKGQWDVGQSEMDKNGKCQRCGEKLVCIDIDPSETETFAKSLAELACKREVRDDFIRFQDWLRRNGPFDAVIDAANVGLYNSKAFSFSQVNSVVNGIQRVTKSKKLPLIVLHRSRVNCGPAKAPQNQKLIESWRNAGALYSTPPGSNDDWYWLYAAVSCRSLLVTNDEMRDHLFQLLGTSFFPRWKEKHQNPGKLYAGQANILGPRSYFPLAASLFNCHSVIVLGCRNPKPGAGTCRRRPETTSRARGSGSVPPGKLRRDHLLHRPKLAPPAKLQRDRLLHRPKLAPPAKLPRDRLLRRPKLVPLAKLWKDRLLRRPKLAPPAKLRRDRLLRHPKLAPPGKLLRDRLLHHPKLAPPGELQRDLLLRRPKFRPPGKLQRDRLLRCPKLPPPAKLPRDRLHHRPKRVHMAHENENFVCCSKLRQQPRTSLSLTSCAKHAAPPATGGGGGGEGVWAGGRSEQQREEAAAGCHGEQGLVVDARFPMASRSAALCFSAAVTSTTATGGGGGRGRSRRRFLVVCCDGGRRSDLLSSSLLTPDNRSGTFFCSVQAAKVLGAPTTFDAAKLTVQYAGAGEAFPRAYTLSHCDFTANLTLAVSETITSEQLRRWGWRRDDVFAEWKEMTCTGGPGGGEMTLHLHCHVSGPNPLQELAAGFRYYVFSKELPLVLKAVVHGDAALFAARPELMDARVWVHFHSSSRKYNRIECWGALREATKAPPASLLRTSEPARHGAPTQKPPRFAKIDFATYDGSDNPLNWLNQCDQFFRGQRTPASERTWLASYHLRGAAQTWYYALEQDEGGMPPWERFRELCLLRFGPPTHGSRLAELGRLLFTSTGERLVALVDTGSTYNFRPEATMRRLALQPTGGEQLRVTVANGDCLRCHGLARDVPITIGDEHFTITCAGIDLGCFEFILGVDFLRNLGPILWDFDALTMTFWRLGRRVRWEGATS
uniref:ribonuclease P n=1 Tax=Aegilops tauschii TaxID=37682 RepID=M8BYR1_AEGTA